jgi:LysM domain
MQSATLQALNPASPPASLQIGATLMLCSCAYTVQSGDTYNKIASAYGTTVANLETLNPTVPANNLQIGESLAVSCT